MKVPTKFTGVHDYLDELFASSDPSDADIILAKKWYWRCYNSHLKRQRKHYSNLSVYFSQEQITRIKTYAEKGKVSDFIKLVVLSYMDSTTSVVKTVDTAIIEQQLFRISDYLEELIQNNSVINTIELQALETKIIVLQAYIDEL
ncbi:hypothetical protein [uncultured Dokdonia sp.]|uniref:hypothetical protein n=1 Tax=uncultured Dokdonia sp. TaxID=575653 RepID=UPI00260CE2CE|nr:hypothetical protein [uncultured Dokdonia sp.]